MEIVLGEGVVVGTSIVRFVAKLRLSIVARVEEAEEARGEDTIELDEVAGEMGLDQVVVNAARTKIGERTVEGGTVGTEDHGSAPPRRPASTTSLPFLLWEARERKRPRQGAGECSARNGARPRED